MRLERFTYPSRSRRSARIGNLSQDFESPGEGKITLAGRLISLQQNPTVDFHGLLKDQSGEIQIRFEKEIYIEGLELANVFTELNDPVEQRERLVSEREERIKAGREACPIDKDSLYTLECGMPPAGGIALGVDRLVMLLTDRSSIEEVISFPFSQMAGIKGVLS